MNPAKYTLIVPVYNNRQNLPDLLEALQSIASALDGPFQAVLIIDGSTDGSQSYLESHLGSLPFACSLLIHSRNFGAFAAIRTGLENCQSDYYAVMAADLQEPPELIIEMLQAVAQQDCDVVVAKRTQRNDPLLTRWASHIFWEFYRTFIIPDIPTGGVGTIACNDIFKTELLKLDEKGSSIIGLIYWLGFRRKEIAYQRQERKAGKSGWSLTKKINYFFDSIFSFSDLPIKLLIAVGLLGFLFSIIMGTGLIVNKMLGLVPVPGYASTFITILFFACINIIGLGIIGAYVWRAFSNTQDRPTAVIMDNKKFNSKKD